MIKYSYMETILDELKQFIVKKINLYETNEFEIDKKYLLCHWYMNSLNKLVFMTETKITFMNNFITFMKKPMSNCHLDRYDVYEFEQTFNQNTFIEIFLRIIANNENDDVGFAKKKVILVNYKTLLYQKYREDDENKRVDKPIFYKQLKLNKTDYFNSEYRIYFYV